MAQPDYYTINELAAKENVHPKTIGNWIKQKKIKAKLVKSKTNSIGAWQIPKATFKTPPPAPTAPNGKGTKKGIKPTTNPKAKSAAPKAAKSPKKKAAKKPAKLAAKAPKKKAPTPVAA